MLQPPVSDFAPWRPGHWITQTGYALNETDVKLGMRTLHLRRKYTQSSVTEVDDIISKVIAK